MLKRRYSTFQIDGSDDGLKWGADERDAVYAVWYGYYEVRLDAERRRAVLPRGAW
jgi:hypothetical protein